MSEFKVSGEELRLLISDAIQMNSIRTEAQFQIIDNKLDGINDHLKKLNGKVAEHERIINERAIFIQQMKDFKESIEDENLPQKVRVLEDVQLSRKSIRNWMVGAISVGVTLGGLIVSIFTLFI